MMTLRCLAVLAVAGCAGGTTLPPARFVNAPPVTAVDDRGDVPVKPEVRRYKQSLQFFEGQIYRPLRRTLVLEQPRRALGTNALDEVPDSTWFTNRIGVRTITPDELRAAPGGVGNPERHLPWTIRSTKVGGMSVGFIVTDARGEKFIVKFDDRGFPEAETGAQIVSGKLLWACGYNVTEDHIAYLRREDLVLAPDAVSEDLFGTKTRLDDAQVDRLLARVDRGADGTYRAMASHFLDGKPLGGHPALGTRDDDPNDVIPHERRRDLRGARAIFAWLDHDDVQEGQFLDMWITDPADTSRHHVKHYFLDYGLSLGVMARVTYNLRRSYEYYVDPYGMIDSFVALGTQPRDWAQRRAPDLRGVGVFEIDAFDPGAWKPMSPAYLPFFVADEHDGYWGAKLVMRFTRDQLAAAVESGRYSDPRAVTYLTDALVARQRKTGAYWFSRVNPLEDIAVVGEDGLCFDDLMLTYGLRSARGTAYALELFDARGQRIAPPVALPATATGRTCARIRVAPDGDGYTIVRITTTRPNAAARTLYVHLARARDSHAPRVIGVWRP